MLETAIQMAVGQQSRILDSLKAGKTPKEFFSDPIEIQFALLISSILTMHNEMSITV
jgi:hypothetical protein